MLDKWFSDPKQREHFTCLSQNDSDMQFKIDDDSHTAVAGAATIATAQEK